VPAKSLVHQHDFSEEQDPIVRAYLQAKLTLFQNAGVVTFDKGYGEKEPTRC
jgi:hypothetical protein